MDNAQWLLSEAVGQPQSQPQTAALRALCSALSYVGTAQAVAEVFALDANPDLFTTTIPAALAR